MKTKTLDNNNVMINQIDPVITNDGMHYSNYNFSSGQVLVETIQLCNFVNQRDPLLDTLVKFSN